MRSYDQYCSIARALDVVGDRWTLLIVRELLLRGPCRFTDIRGGLPGVATNLLSSRLRELEQAGLIRREEAPPPIATTLYHLTDNGLALESVLKALGLWGLRLMDVEKPEDRFDVHWLAYAPEWFVLDGDPDAAPVTIQLVAAGKHAVVELGGGQVRSRVGRAAHPDLTLTGPPRAVLGLVSGMIDVDLATLIGLTVEGRGEILDRLRPVPQPAPAVRFSEP